MGENFVHIVARHVDRNGESDTLVAAGVAGENGCVDADQMTFVIDQRSAGGCPD
jgi:hypothetical protein